MMIRYEPQQCRPFIRFRPIGSRHFVLRIGRDGGPRTGEPLAGAVCPASKGGREPAAVPAGRSAQGGGVALLGSLAAAETVYQE